MNTKIRYIVMNASNQPVVPASLGMALPDLQSAKSPSFLKRETAQAFAKLCAKRHKGQNFYVAQVLGGAVAYTALDESATEGVTWTDATADGTE